MVKFISLSLIWGVTAVMALTLSVSKYIADTVETLFIFFATDGFRFLQRHYSVYDTTDSLVGLAMTPNTTAETNQSEFHLCR